MNGTSVTGARAAPIDALKASAVWTDVQLSCFFQHCQEPLRATRQYLRREKKKGLILDTVVDTYFPLQEQLTVQHVRRPGGNHPNYGKLAYKNSLRWDIPPRPVRVFYASPLFGSIHGSWCGSDSIDANKVAHDLVVSSVWLLYLQQKTELALRHWVSERRLQFEYRRGRHRGPIPDALIRGKRHNTAVEILGAGYSKHTIARHIRRFAEQGWHSVLW